MTTRSQDRSHFSLEYLSKSKSEIDETSPPTPSKVDTSLKSEQFSTPLVHFNKENESLNASAGALNISGLVKTTFTPTTTPRSSLRSRKTPSRFDSSTSASSKTPSSPSRALGESPKTAAEVNTPSGLKKSMHVVDLRTPFKSTPKSARKTPKSNVLLKSALKNSTVKSFAANESNRRLLTFKEESMNESSASELSTINVSSESEAHYVSSQEELQPSPKAPRMTFSEFDGVGSMLASPSNSTNNSTVIHVEQNKTLSAGDDCTNLTGVSKLMKTPQRLPKNELDNMRGVKELMKTPAPNASINVSGIADLMRSPEPPVRQDDTLNLTAVENLMKTPIRPAKPDASNLTGVAELLKTPMTMTTDSDVAELCNKIDEALEDSASVEVKSQDSDFEKKMEKALFGTIRLSKSELMHTSIDFEKAVYSSPEMNVTNDEPSSAEVNEQDKKKIILNWVEKCRDSLAKQEQGTVEGDENEDESGKSEKCGEYPRYSDITNTSINQSDSAVRYDAGPKVSIVHTMMNSSYKTSKLTMSPVTRHSLPGSGNGEIIENYILAKDRNVTKSLRSTRKKLGNALAYLNTSNMANDSFDANSTMNTNVPEEAVNQSTRSEAPEFMSLDNQPKVDEQVDQVDEAQQQTSNVYMQFATDAGEMNNDHQESKNIFEVSSDDSIEEVDQDSSSESEEESSEGECSAEDTEKDSDNEQTAQHGTMRLSDPNLAVSEDGINPLEESKTDSQIAAELQDEAENADQDQNNDETKSFFVESSHIEDMDEKSEIIDFVSSDDIADEAEENADAEMKSVEQENCNDTMSGADKSNNKPDISQTTLYPVNDTYMSDDVFQTTAKNESTVDDDFEIPATQFPAESEDFEIPATQDVVMESENEADDTIADENIGDDEAEVVEEEKMEIIVQQTADEAQALAEAAKELDESHNYSTVHHNETIQVNDDINKTSPENENEKNESLMFSETEFSRVEINADIMSSDNDGKLIILIKNIQ